MKWIKGYLESDMGRSIGKLPGETVYLNPDNGLLAIKDGGEPYFKHIEGMSQYNFKAENDPLIEQLFPVVQPAEVEQKEVAEIVENKPKAKKKK